MYISISAVFNCQKQHIKREKAWFDFPLTTTEITKLLVVHCVDNKRL